MKISTINSSMRSVTDKAVDRECFTKKFISRKFINTFIEDALKISKVKYLFNHTYTHAFWINNYLSTNSSGLVPSLLFKLWFYSRVAGQIRSKGSRSSTCAKQKTFLCSNTTYLFVGIYIIRNVRTAYKFFRSFWNFGGKLDNRSSA